MRADAARYLYMHKYGGLYTDLDIEALRSFDHVLTNTTASVLLAYMGTDYKYPHNIPNAFMASKPGYVFFGQVGVDVSWGNGGYWWVSEYVVNAWCFCPICNSLCPTPPKGTHCGCTV